MHFFISRSLVLASALLLTSLCYCQKDSMVYFFDKDYASCKKEDLKYVGFGVKEKGGIKFTCFVGATGVLTTEGFFSDSTLAVKQGLFRYYDDAGYKISEGRYKDNKEDGVWLGWHHGDANFNDSSYYLNDSSYFENGETVTQVSFNYYANGVLLSRYFSDYRKKIKDITTWNEQGQIRSKAFWANDTGDETWFYPNGNIYSVTISKKGKVISKKYFNVDGQEMTRTEVKNADRNFENQLQNLKKEAQESQPYFPGGAAGFRSYMEKHVQFPPDFLRQLPLGETVRISFKLNQSGFAYDIKVLEFQNFDLQNAIINAFKYMPAWDMKGRKDFGPIVYALTVSRY